MSERLRISGCMNEVTDKNQTNDRDEKFSKKVKHLYLDETMLTSEIKLNRI